jgi:myo-inositol-1(or 4)-monophosphatase
MSERADIPLPTLTEVAITAARAGGSALFEQRRVGYQVQFKGEIDLVTDADRRSERTVVSVLKSRFPDHQILAEEGSTGGDSARYRWIIDPLDGTTNFAHGYPHYGVSIALEIDGSLGVGVVYDPNLDELFHAAAGAGAFLNGKPIRVSETDQLLRSLLCTGFPYDRSKLNGSLRHWQYFVRRAQGVRRDGSAALDICYVAAGRFDAFWEDHLFPWDFAAATLIVQEAGGLVTDYGGDPTDLSQGEIVASNGRIHPTMLRGLGPSGVRG